MALHGHIIITTLSERQRTYSPGTKKNGTLIEKTTTNAGEKEQNK